MTSLIDVATF